MYLISPPLSVYVLIILLLLLLLFVVHQFAGLCSQQKQMGNICPGRPGPPPGPRVSVCPQLSLAPRAVALLLYLDKPFFRDCRTQQGPCGPPARPRGRGAAGEGRGGEVRAWASGKARQQDLSLAVFLPNPAQASPACAPVLCRAMKYYYW